jgi:hypothetical protein
MILFDVVNRTRNADEQTNPVLRRCRFTAHTVDYALSKITTDYETSLYAAMASFIIHM